MEKNTMNEQSSLETRMDEKDKKKKKLLLLFLLLALLIGGLWYLHQSSTPEYDGHAYNDPIKKGKTWSAGDLVIPGYGEVPVKKSDEKVQITLGNSKINKAYFRYKVQVKQRSKYITIENSKLIKPGNAITEIPTKGLEMKPGRYPMKITIKAYSLKNSNAPLNGSIVDATLVIQ